MTTILDKSTEILTAVFKDMPQARQVLEELRQAGVPDQDLALLSSGDYYPEETYRVIDGEYLEKDRDAVEDGAEVGAALGGTGGFLLGLSTVAIPGVGPLLVVGTTLCALIAGMSVGALAGGAAGVLMELGYSRDQAEKMSASLGEGEVLLLVKPGSLGRRPITRMLSAHEPVSLVLEKPGACE